VEGRQTGRKRGALGLGKKKIIRIKGGPQLGNAPSENRPIEERRGGNRSTIPRDLGEAIRALSGTICFPKERKHRKSSLDGKRILSSRPEIASTLEKFAWEEGGNISGRFKRGRSK